MLDKCIKGLNEYLTTKDKIVVNKLDKQMTAVTNVLRKIIHDLGNVENLAQGTLTTLKTFMGEKEWDKVIKELKDKDIIKDKKEKKLEV